MARKWRGATARRAFGNVHLRRHRRAAFAHPQGSAQALPRFASASASASAAAHDAYTAASPIARRRRRSHSMEGTMPDLAMRAMFLVTPDRTSTQCPPPARGRRHHGARRRSRRHARSFFPIFPCATAPERFFPPLELP
ncbi:hypothetical protein [Xanthomonas medicagonis]|uniref:hypothetical protein n=1 Tax=Xanthomonas medicagonis TaxID=3160841 RepID=UPI0035144CCF